MTCMPLILALLSLGAARASGPPSLVEIIQVGGVPNQFDVYDFVFVDDMGGVTLQSWNDADGDTIVATPVPPTPAVLQKFVHNPICSFMQITNEDPLPTGTQQAQVPMLMDFTTGDTLVPSVSVVDLGLMPVLPVGTRFTVVNGAAVSLPRATILAPIMPFNDIPLPLFADPGVFPPFTGTAEVVGILDLTVIVRCAADVDANGEVDINDLLQLLAAWGPCAQPCPPDTNWDGTVDITDLLELLAVWGPCP